MVFVGFWGANNKFPQPLPVAASSPQFPQKKRYCRSVLLCKEFICILTEMVEDV